MGLREAGRQVHDVYINCGVGVCFGNFDMVFHHVSESSAAICQSLARCLNSQLSTQHQTTRSSVLLRNNDPRRSSEAMPTLLKPSPALNPIP